MARLVMLLVSTHCLARRSALDEYTVRTFDVFHIGHRAGGRCLVVVIAYVS